MTTRAPAVLKSCSSKPNKLKTKQLVQPYDNVYLRHQATVEIDVHQGEDQEEVTRVSFVFLQKDLTSKLRNVLRHANLNSPCFQVYASCKPILLSDDAHTVGHRDFPLLCFSFFSSFITQSILRGSGKIFG